MVTVIKTEPESIIEYSQEKDSPVFSYDEKTGAISIFADKSMWIWRNKFTKINVNIYYDNNKYNLLLLSKIKNVLTDDFITSGVDIIMLYNTSLFPKFIKKGTLLGKAILVPKIESHILKIELT